MSEIDNRKRPSSTSQMYRLHEDEWLLGALADHLLGILQPNSEAVTDEDETLAHARADASLGYIGGVLANRADQDRRHLTDEERAVIDAYLATVGKAHSAPSQGVTE